MVYVAHGLSLNMLGAGPRKINVETVSQQEAASMLRHSGFKSLVRNKVIAQLLSQQLHAPIPLDRSFITLQPGDQVLCALFWWEKDGSDGYHLKFYRLLVES